MTLVIAASPLIATAASRDRARTLHRAADGLADDLRIDDRLLVDGVQRRRLGGIGLDAVGVAGLRKLDELH
jgi:hypothetical protein